eukprot:393898_1
MLRLSLLALVVLHACTALAWVFPLTLSRFRVESSAGESLIRGQLSRWKAMTVQPNQAGNRYGVGKVGLGRLCRDRNCLYGRRVSTTQINMAADSTQAPVSTATSKKEQRLADRRTRMERLTSEERENLKQLLKEKRQKQMEEVERDQWLGEDMEYDDDEGSYFAGKSFGTEEAVEKGDKGVFAAEEKLLSREMGLFQMICMAYMGIWGAKIVWLFFWNGLNPKKAVVVDNVRWEFIVTEEEHLKELHAYKCDDCGYTLFPARGRHQYFFEDVDDFACPECGAPKASFYDLYDEDDPRNHKSEGEEETEDDQLNKTIADAEVSEVTGSSSENEEKEEEEEGDVGN